MDLDWVLFSFFPSSVIPDSPKGSSGLLSDFGYKQSADSSSDVVTVPPNSNSVPESSTPVASTQSPPSEDEVEETGY